MHLEIRERLADYMTENREQFYRLAYSHVRNREAALDIVQNAIVKALENYASMQKPEYMRTWFYRILVNECYGFLRKNRWELSYDSEKLSSLVKESNGEQMRGEDQISYEVYERIRKLPDKIKTVIILRFYEDMKLEEISRVTGAGLSTVKYRLYTGLKKLEKSLKEGAE